MARQRSPFFYAAFVLCNSKPFFVSPFSWPTTPPCLVLSTLSHTHLVSLIFTSTSGRRRAGTEERWNSCVRKRALHWVPLFTFAFLFNFFKRRRGRRRRRRNMPPSLSTCVCVFKCVRVCVWSVCVPFFFLFQTPSAQPFFTIWKRNSFSQYRRSVKINTRYFVLPFSPFFFFFFCSRLRTSSRISWLLPYSPHWHDFLCCTLNKWQWFKLSFRARISTVWMRIRFFFKFHSVNSRLVVSCVVRQ